MTNTPNLSPNPQPAAQSDDEDPRIAQRDDDGPIPLRAEDEQDD